MQMHLERIPRSTLSFLQHPCSASLAMNMPVGCGEWIGIGGQIQWVERLGVDISMEKKGGGGTSAYRWLLACCDGAKRRRWQAEGGKGATMHGEGDATLSR
ncbi:hypothetical protein E2562_019832 [Oryza meyeriana var. granulata]|uniref:Uncharacterized protein n=1 Tax=Oryza meyeriana var. granulata TaxID=110450 RepID=A0A6G1CRX3_9ORYZ|nr:hypothetical protein E2562_019832 [Oryza meyeriana var. granulata]